jgi:SAM-dependent methyltransferase
MQHRNITFAQCAVEDYADVALFDAVIGRYVLIHQSDPVGFLRAATRLLRPGGILAFHEIEFGRLRSLPNVEIWDKTAHVILDFFGRTLPHHDIANRLIDLFAAVELPCPKMFCEIPVGGGAASPIYAWFAEGIRSVLPQIAQMGMATGDLMPIDSLESRLRAATVATHSQVEGGTRSDLCLGHSLTGRRRNIVSGKHAFLDISTGAPLAKKMGTAVQDFQASTA